jgi:hypothetical protein
LANYHLLGPPAVPPSILPSVIFLTVRDRDDEVYSVTASC